MHITCSKSGIQFSLPHVDRLRAICAHPIFSVPQQSLLAQVPNWQLGRLDEPSTVLLFLALIDSTQRVHWRAPFRLTDSALPMIQRNMQRTAGVVYRLNEITSPALHVPEFTTSYKDNGNTVEALIGLVELWEDIIANFSARYKQAVLGKKLTRIESILVRTTNRSAKNIALHSRALAEWAATAGEFPENEIIRRGKAVTTAELWKQIIQDSASGNVLTYALDDFVDLLEWCEFSIPHGTVYAHNLMGTIREGFRVRREFEGLPGTYNTKVFSILPRTSQEVQAVAAGVAYMAKLAESAPELEPRKWQYKTEFEFLKAHARWKIAQFMKAKEPAAPALEEEIVDDSEAATGASDD